MCIFRDNNIAISDAEKKSHEENSYNVVDGKTVMDRWGKEAVKEKNEDLLD